MWKDQGYPEMEFADEVRGLLSPMCAELRSSQETAIQLPSLDGIFSKTRCTPLLPLTVLSFAAQGSKERQGGDVLQKLLRNLSLKQLCLVPAPTPSPCGLFPMTVWCAGLRCCNYVHCWRRVCACCWCLLRSPRCLLPYHSP